MGQVIAKHKLARYCDLEAAADGCAFRRNRERSAQEARLDGLSVLRASLPASELGAAATVRACRSFQTVALQVRPSPRYRPESVRAPVFLCMLAYHVAWHMRRQFALLLFGDDSQAAPAGRASVAALPRLPGGAAQGRRPAHPAAQLPHAPRRLGDHRPAPGAAPTGPSPVTCSPAPHRCSDKPSTCSARAWGVPSAASPQMGDSANKPMAYVNI